MELTKEEITEVAKRGLANPHFFCKFFLEKWFPGPMPWVHRGLLAILTRRCEFLLEFDEHYGPKDLMKIIAHFTWKDDPNDPESKEHSIFRVWKENGVLRIEMTLSRFTLIMMPRGSSKTTIANAVNVWYIVYQECKFPVYVSESETHAATQLTNVAIQLRTNPRIRAVFGTFEPEQRSGLRWSESEGFIQTSTGVSLRARGRGSQIRGLNVDAERPDRIQVDDVEDKESVDTDTQRMKTKTWFFGDLLPALPELNPDATIVVLATLLHAEALPTILMKDPEWTCINIGVIDRDGDALWPAWMDLGKIERKKQSYALKGLLHIFYLEYFNTIRNPENSKFKPEYIIVEPVAIDLVPYRSIAVDPAISKKKKADQAVIMVVGMRENGIIQFLDGWGKFGATPREIVNEYFRLKVKWKTMRQGVEAIAYQAALIHLLQEEMFRMGKTYGPEAYFEITPLGHSNKKEERIEGVLQPRFASGYCRLQRRFPEFETQLLDWPNGKKDWADAGAMAVSLLDDFAPIAAGLEHSVDKDEMPPLEDEIGGNWRMA